jgi:hypothetical protein
LVIVSLDQRIIGAFKENGFSSIIGLNIVWRRIRLIASTVIFLRMIEWMKNLVMMPSKHWGLTLGKMHTWHFQNMMERSTISIGQNMKILMIKEEV